ncbi:MAG: gliding motility protein GldM [Flavobacteriales bacterium]|nr:gliding motility protein GldM [Flavobacteriales bacterium]
MAGSKETPRQKMIGMMYLVLTALLALNISKDVLDAFVNVDESLTITNSAMAMKTGSLYSDFDLARSIDPEKVGHYWKRAQEAKALSATLHLFIDSIKTALVSGTEGIPIVEADTMGLRNVNKKDAYDMPTHIMMGDGEGSKGVAVALKQRLEIYQENMRGLLDEADRPSLSTSIDLSDRKMKDATSTWEANMFYHTPLAATITILTKLQGDVATMEQDVVNRLFRSFNRKDFFFDTIAATVLPQSSYVLQGEKYSADIIVAAYSTTRSPGIRIGKLNADGTDLASVTSTVPGINGMGRYEVDASREGVFTYEGMVDLTDSEGKVQSYPFRSEYIVARPSLVVSATSMNQFYKGVENPVSISVPGIPSERIRATITGGNTLRKAGAQEYLAVISPSSPASVTVNVSAVMDDGSTRNMGSMEFRVSRLPKPALTLSGKDGTIRMTANELKAQLGLSSRYDPSFAYNGICTIKRFNVLMMNNQGDILVRKQFNGNRFDNELKNAFDKARKGFRITFEDVRAVGVDEVEHTLGPIIVEVI